MPPKQKPGVEKKQKQPKRKRRNRKRSRKNKNQGTNSGGMNAPQRGRFGGNKPHRLSGRDFIGAVTLSNEATSTPLVSQLISPSRFADTRQQVISSVYEKYRYTRCTMEYVPACASTTGGQMVAYYDMDPTDHEGSVAAAAAHAGAVEFNAYTKTTMALPRTRGGPWFTGAKPATEDEKFYSQARLVVVPVVPATGIGIETPQVVGALYLNWTIEFLNPQIASAQDESVISDLGLASASRYDSEGAPGTSVTKAWANPGTYFGHPVEVMLRTGSTPWPGPGVDLMETDATDWNDETRWVDVGIKSRLPLPGPGGVNQGWAVHDDFPFIFLRNHPTTGKLQYHTQGNLSGNWLIWGPVDLGDTAMRIMDEFLPHVRFLPNVSKEKDMAVLLRRIAALERALLPVRGKQEVLTCDSEDTSSEEAEEWPGENESVSSAVCRESDQSTQAPKPCGSTFGPHIQ